MPLPRSLLFLALVLQTAATTASADSDTNKERSLLAQLLVFGRAGETVEASPAPLAEQIAQRRAALANDPTKREQTARAAWRDAFGREPSAAEWSAELALPHTYTERMGQHLARLRAEPPENRATIQRAYRLVVHRDAYSEEFDYWRTHGVRSFVVLVACIEDWARRNQPGLMVTAGTPTIPASSRFVTIVPVPPALAVEVRATLVSETESRVLAVSGDHIVTAGDMHLALVGRD